MKIQTQNPDEKTTVVRCGHAIVRVNKMAREKYTTYRLAWRVGRKTYYRAYNDEAAALAEADRIVRHLATCDGNATALSGEDVSYMNECKERLGKVPMHAAVEFYLKFHEMTSQNPQTFSEVWDAFYKRVEDRRLSNRYYQTLRHHRNVWEPTFGKRFIDTIGNEEYLNFLRSLPRSPRTKHNLFGSLVALLRYARKQRFISQDKVEIEADFPAIGDETPEFYSPKELLAVFAATDKRYLAYTALMAFGGSRRSEAGSRKLTMASVLFEEKMIRLSPEITKTRTGRTLDITPNLEAWLKEFGPEDGPLVATHKIHPPDADLLKTLGVATKDNALRHSFCSYHLAIHRNSAMTAEVAGNSPSTLTKHYKALVSRAAAEEWFGITPDSVRKFALEKGIRLEW
jgi:integrase